MSQSERIPNLIEEALAALRGEQYARAVAIADQLAVDLPDHALVRAIRAQGLLYGDDPEAALAEAQTAVELDPANAHSRILLGYAAWRCERPTLAESAFQAAVLRSGREPFFLAEYAWFSANERAPKAAETAARGAIDSDAASSTAWAALGLAQFRMHRREDAESSLRRALALNPRDIYAQSAMVALLQEQGKTKEAESLAEIVSKHAGAEDLADSLRQDAKERKIAAMLLERNIDLDAPPPEHPLRIWLAIIFASCSLGGIILCLDPYRWLAALLFAAIPPLLIWVYLKMWE